MYDPARDADTIADALIAYLDTGTAPGTITLENTFVAGEESCEGEGVVTQRRRRVSPRLRLLSPADGEAVDLATPALTRWLRRLDAPQAGAGPVDYMALERQGKERSLAKEIPLRWEGPPDIRYKVELVRDGAPWDCIRRIVTGTVCGVTNLRLGATYRWNVVAEDGTASDSFSFTTSDTPPRLITVGGISNVRDIGGWKVPGGRVRQGMVYRGGELERNMVLTDEGRRVMAEELGIRTDVDLRREVALESSPIGSARLVRIVINAYAELVNDFGPACRSFFDLLCDPSAYPVYVHCFGGADRTGSVVLVLNAALGVADSDLLLDYELTSLSIWGERSRSLDLFQDFLAALRPFGRPGDSLCLQCRGFLASLGFTDAHLARLRALLVEEDSHVDLRG